MTAPTLSQCVAGLSHPDRTVQIIKRDAAGNDVLVLDILGPELEGAQGITLGEDMEGFYSIPKTAPLKKWAYQEGATPSALPRKDERRPRCNLTTRANTVAGWEAIESMLWETLNIDEDVFWRQYDSRGQWRELKVRLLKEPDDKTKKIIGKVPWRTWPVELLAADPFWYSPELKASLSRSQMTQTSPGVWEGTITAYNESTTEKAYPIFGNSEATADETWVLPDGDSGLTVTLPVLGPGKEFEMDTYPGNLLVVRDQSLAAARMRVQSFRNPLAKKTPVPRQLPVKLIGGSATSSLTMWTPQRHDRPFG